MIILLHLVCSNTSLDFNILFAGVCIRVFDGLSSGLNLNVTHIYVINKDERDMLPFVTNQQKSQQHEASNKSAVS